MTESMLHPTPERLEAYVEGSLDDADRAVVDSHLLACPRCQSEVEAWQTLFDQLEALPRPAPAPGFADRVMGQIRAQTPWPARVAAFLGRLLPRTTTGWALAAAFLALPALAAAGAVAWVMSRPWLSFQGLWLFVSQRAVAALGALVSRAGGVVMETELGIWIGEAVQALLDEPALAPLGIGLALFAVLTTLSGWILYRNVFRTSTREDQYALYSF